MDLMPLGTSPLQVPPLAVGAMWWGTRVPTAAAHALLDRAVDRGACFIDTANNYPCWYTGGLGDESETCLGEWIGSRGSSGRDGIVLATKVGARRTTPGAGFDQVCGLGRTAVLEQVAGSLRRLRTSHVDLLYAHIDDATVPLSETVGALQEIVERGWARAIAASNLTADRLVAALNAGTETPRYVALQNRFTLLSPDPTAELGPQVLLDDEVEAVCATYGVAMVGYSTLLEGAYTRPDRHLPAHYRRPGTAEALRALSAVAAELGVDPGQAVLAWMTHRGTPVVPVVGISRPDQLDSAVTGVTTAVPEAALATLEHARQQAR